MATVQVTRCADCDFFIPIDVFKGTCHINKSILLTDDTPCEECEPVRKCKFCSNFTPAQENLGLCKGKAIAYPEMVARTCEMFLQKQGSSDQGREAAP